jgi:hypothetical protein
MSSPAARSPEPAHSGRHSADADGLEPAPEWVGDAEAAARFGSPEAIRVALPPDQTGDFDAAFDAALTAARQTLHLDQLRDTLRAWRRVALLTRQDPDAARRLAASIADIRGSGKPRPGSLSWTDLRAQPGL